MLTDFEKVCEFNKSFDFPQHDDLTDDKCITLRLDLIKEELDELKEAYDQNDIIEEQDACADILYVAYGMAYTYKYNSDDYIKSYYYFNTTGHTLFEKLEYNTTSKRDILLNKVFETYYNLEKTATIKDMERTMSILHKLIYYVYEFQYISKYDSDRIFSIVHDSNMSKLCKTEEDAIETVNRYKNETPQRYDSPNYRKADDGIHWVVYNESTMKILKNYKYTTVDFSSLINQ